MIHTCLSIAGFDGSGGAGMQADLKTFAALGCYGMNVLTALPVQNTCGVRSCYDIPLDCIREQMHAIFDDIMPDSIKIGMLYSADIVHLVAECLSQRASSIPIVLDPVMVSTQGNTLLKEDAIHALLERMIPMATIVTPNLPEAKAFIPNVDDPSKLASTLLTLGCQAVLLKGGHDTNHTADDIFLDQTGKHEILSSERIQTNNTHGTGCTLSAGIAAYLAMGENLLTACRLAKSYLFEAMLAAQHIQLGKGHGPVDHAYRTRK